MGGKSREISMSARKTKEKKEHGATRLISVTTTSAKSIVRQRNTNIRVVYYTIHTFFPYAIEEKGRSSLSSLVGTKKLKKDTALFFVWIAVSQLTYLPHDEIEKYYDSELAMNYGANENQTSDTHIHV